MNPSRTAARWDRPAPARLALRLYVAGDLPHSAEAIANLRQLCAPDAPGVELEIVDVLASPARALADGIVATPTLIRLSPLPAVRILGTLADTARVRAALGLGDHSHSPS